MTQTAFQNHYAMKTKKSLLVLLLISGIFFSAFSQTDLTGDWHGVLDVQGMMKLRIVFHLKNDSGKLISTLDSPDQSAYGLPVGETAYNHPKLIFAMPNLGAKFDGTVNEAITEIKGVFRQGGMDMPLLLTRQAIEMPAMKRPQEPKPPFPYLEQEVFFVNKTAGDTLAGTLTLPRKEGKFPVVVLVSGSGPQDRNEELLGHKPFLVLADHLTRQGIAVLRYDDRGVGKSTGKFSGCTSEDFAADALAAVAWLKTRPEIDPKKIGIAGHSEGGLIAPMCAVQSKDVAFIVLLAGTGVDGEAVLLKQFELIYGANGMEEEKLKKELATSAQEFQLIKTVKDTAQLRLKLKAFLEKEYSNLPEGERKSADDLQKQIKDEIDLLTSPWFSFFIRYDPKVSLEKVKCPVLALNGEKDLQVEPKSNLTGIRAGLEKAGNKQFVVKELPGLNHLFQACETGSPAEYSMIEETFSPVALKEISDWILSVTR